MARAYAPVYDHDEERISIPAYAFTFEGFQRWMTSGEVQETGRIDYLAGRVEVDLSPEDLQTHGVLKLEIGSKLHELIRRRRLGQVFTDSTRITNALAGLSTEPDVVVVFWETLRSGRARYVTPVPGQPGSLPEIQGTPDLVVEVVSRTSERKDRKVLPELYAKAGIPELWLADALGSELRFEIFTLEGGIYSAIVPDDQGWLGSPRLDLRFRLRREPDVLESTWLYILEHEP